jgi:5-methylthioadenosine/S-adenosylhomocysteine deaminase
VPVRLIRNCSVLEVPAVGEVTVTTHQDIEITDGVITAVRATRDGHVDGQVVDATGLLAIPGLTNSHTHSPMVMFRGAAEDVSVDDWFNSRIWPMEVNLTPERVRVGARLACAEMLLRGVTGFVDHYWPHRSSASGPTSRRRTSRRRAPRVGRPPSTRWTGSSR